MPFRSAVSIEDKRAALEELRTAHRILVGIAGADRRWTYWLGAVLDLLRPRSLLEATWNAQHEREHEASELEHARRCVRRALVHLRGDERVDIDTAEATRVRMVIGRLFDRIRASDAALQSIDPLSTD